MPPTEYENQYYQRLGSVWIIRGDAIPPAGLNYLLHDYGKSAQLKIHNPAAKN